MKTHTLAALLLASSCMLAACGGSTTTSSTTTTDSVKAVPLAPVSLASVTPSPDFPGATITVGTVKTVHVDGKDSTKVTFNFDVKGYELKMQTTDNGTKMCNNSDKGQHIHFILDNGPYKALYEPTNEVTLANNTEHYLVAFLSRSYHESIKSKGAAIIWHFKIDEKGNMKKLEDPKTPMITYSRPKGEYTGKDTANVLLDFYVWNCELGAAGYKVKADIANEDRSTQTLSATIDKWAPNFIQNLGTGKCKVTLTLIDKDGKQVDGPMTTVSREFTLKAQ